MTVYFISEQIPRKYRNCKGCPPPKVKIGITSRSVQLRLKEIQTDNGWPLKIELEVQTPNDREVETYYHTRHKKHNTHGEWFLFVDDIKEDIARIKRGQPFYKRISWGRIFVWALISSGLLCAASIAILTIISQL